MAIVVLTIGLVALCAVAIASVYAQYRQRVRLHESLNLMADAHNTFKKRFEAVLETFERSTPVERRMAHKTEALLRQASYYGDLTTQNVLTAIKRLGYEQLGHGERGNRVYSGRVGTAILICDYHVREKPATRQTAVRPASSDWPAKIWGLPSGAYEIAESSGDLAAFMAFVADPKSADWAPAYELSRAVERKTHVPELKRMARQLLAGG